MGIFIQLLIAGMLLFSLSSCKLLSGKKKEEDHGNTYGGTFKEGKVKVGVPRDLKNFVPSPNSTTRPKSTPSLKGLNLQSGQPVSAQGIEEIVSHCFTEDSNFIAENWYFHAALKESGVVIKEYNASVNRCNEMQLELKKLNKNKEYQILSSFYWDSEAGQAEVYYEGETKPFRPGDESITLVLEKLLVEQKVNVEVQKSEKDKCIDKKYLWNGKRCLDGYNSISFTHADFSDYAESSEVSGSRKRKCLQKGDENGYAVQYECNYKEAQRFLTKLHGIQEVLNNPPPNEYGWFFIQFDGGNSGEKFCLQAYKGDPYPYLLQRPCITKPTATNQRAFLAQLFNLIETKPGDVGPRESFRIMNQFPVGSNIQTLCFSIPPEKYDATGVQPLRDGAPLRLTDCNTDDPNIRKSQFIQFTNNTD